uniref:Uncharacterized protein n=1 Tax=Sphaerodactylus townsendi TaxID=933632 RepID=A0ACB8ET08_9SAUR
MLSVVHRIIGHKEAICMDNVYMKFFLIAEQTELCIQRGVATGKSHLCARVSCCCSRRIAAQALCKFCNQGKIQTIVTRIYFAYKSFIFVVFTLFWLKLFVRTEQYNPAKNIDL